MCVGLPRTPSSAPCIRFADYVIHLSGDRHASITLACLAQAVVTPQNVFARLLPTMAVASGCAALGRRFGPSNRIRRMRVTVARWTPSECIAASMTTRLVRSPRHYPPLPDAASPLQCASRSTSCHPSASQARGGNEKSRPVSRSGFHKFWTHLPRPV